MLVALTTNRKPARVCKAAGFGARHSGNLQGGFFSTVALLVTTIGIFIYLNRVPWFVCCSFFRDGRAGAGVWIPASDAHWLRYMPVVMSY